ncbi:MAG: hypothetical protein ACRERR_04965 [Moraxellaceae bacterium]
MIDLKQMEAARQECRALVRKRALLSAGAAAVPVPFMDIVVDASILMQLIPEISRRFGLEPEYIEKMDEQQREKVWAQIRARGSQLIGIVLTRAIVRKTFMDFAGRIAARQVSKFIPFGGQIVAAGLGYFVMRRMAYKHIDDCFAVAATL